MNKNRGTSRRLSPSRIVGFIICLLLLGFVYYINVLTPLFADDYCYMFSFADKERIGSLSDLFASLGAHYKSVNGRLVVHFFAFAFQIIGDGAFNVINTLAFALLVLVMYYHAFGTLKGLKPAACVFLTLGLFVLTPKFGQSFLWMTGSANYLYGMLILLACFIPFRRWAEGKTESRGFGFALLCLVLGLLGGWTNENTSCALIAAAFCFMLWSLIRDGRVPVWMIAFFVGAVAGLLIMILAPGEQSRLDLSGGFSLSQAFSRVPDVTAKAVRYFGALAVLVAVLIVLFFARGGKQRAERLILPAIYVFAALISAYAMIASPQFPARVWSGSVIFALIGAAALFDAVFRDVKAPGAASVVCCALSLVLIVLSSNIPALRDTADRTRRRDESARAQIEAGADTLYLPGISCGDSPLDCYELWDDIVDDPQNWMNGALADYYGAEAVIAEK